VYHILFLTPDEIAQISTTPGLIVRLFGEEFRIMSTSVFNPDEVDQGVGPAHPPRKPPRVVRVVDPPTPGKPPQS
jgi:hypothetical protein